MRIHILGRILKRQAVKADYHLSCIHENRLKIASLFFFSPMINYSSLSEPSSMREKTISYPSLP